MERNGGEIEPIEGFYLEDHHGTIFAVKGIMHPRKKYIVVPRYLPSWMGDREGRGKRYLKLPSSTYKISMNRWPHLLQLDPYLGIELLMMEEKDVKKKYDPISKLEELRSGATTYLQRACVHLSKMLEERGVDSWSLGVTGSILVGLEKGSSDIDLVVYGLRNSAKVYEAMLQMRNEGCTISVEESPNPMGLPKEIHVMHERRKLLKGILKFCDGKINYLIRCIPLQEEYPERYGEAKHLDRGPIELEARVIEDRFGFLLPTRYSIQTLDNDGVQMDVVSYGGVICEQARDGEKVLISGKLDERVGVGSGKKVSEIVVDMGGHYFYNPELSKI
ncbi:MAG: hypothetical protein ACUVTL_00940 [Thermoproteota archaeon]